MYYVYLIQNSINKSIYVGVTKNIKRRWKAHLDWTFNKYKKKFPLNKAILKYGKDNFSIKIIEKTSTWENVLHLEICWIAQFKDSGYTLYNVTNGGDGCSGELISAAKRGHTVSVKTREKIRKSLTGRKLPEATKEKLRNLPRRGRKLNDAQYSEVLGLLHKNIKKTDIAKQFGISIAAVSHIAKTNGFKMFDNKFKLSEQQINDIVYDLKNSELSHREIAVKFGIKYSSVVTITNKFNIKRSKFAMGQC